MVYYKFFIFIAFASGLLTGCVNSINTEGILNVKGKVSDESTKNGIPRKSVIIQGLVNSNNKLMPIEAGQFSTDSSGCFTYSLKKIKGAKNYNFCFVGDSENLFATNEITLFDLERNAEFLSFSLPKLVNLTIRSNRKSKTPVCDTLCLSWESDGVYFWFLYPYSVENYGKRTSSFGPKSDLGLTWIGGKVNSSVNTKVFADKRTKVVWELYRYGKRMEFTDTLTCRRDITNIINFSY